MIWLPDVLDKLSLVKLSPTLAGCFAAPLVFLACADPPSTAPQDRVSGPHYSAPATCKQRTRPGTVDGLERWPYPQSTTPTSTTIVFGTPPELGDGTIALSRGPDYELEPAATRVTGVSIGDDKMWLWELDFEGLEPGTEYCYRVSADGEVLADGLRFRTAPASWEAPIRFMVIGDFGAGTEEQYQVKEQMMAWREGVDLLITTGDNAYNSGTWEEWHYDVFGVYQELLTGLTLFATPGNHDYGTDDAAPMLANLVNPRNAWRPEDAERYYTTTWGPLRLLALDSNDPNYQLSEDEDDDQKDWATAWLANNEHPWVVPAYHHPAVTGHETRDPDIFMLYHYTPLFERYGVRVALQGHDHFYERFHPLSEQTSTLAEWGVTYITTGGGGRSLYRQRDEPRRAVGLTAHHFLLGEADACTMTLQAIHHDGKILDTLVLERDC